MATAQSEMQAARAAVVERMRRDGWAPELRVSTWGRTLGARRDLVVFDIYRWAPLRPGRGSQPDGEPYGPLPRVRGDGDWVAVAQGEATVEDGDVASVRIRSLV